MIVENDLNGQEFITTFTELKVVSKIQVFIFIFYYYYY